MNTMSSRVFFRLLGGLFVLGLLGMGPGCQREMEADFSASEIAGSDLVVAEVAGEPITAGYLYHKIRIQYPQMPQSGPSLGLQAQEIVKMVAVEHCLAKMAEDKGFDKDPDFLRMLYLSRAHLLSRVAVEEGIANRGGTSEEELRQYYEDNQERFVIGEQAWYSHVLLDSETAARMVLAQLEAGADFAELARKYSRDKVTAKRGGEMPPASRKAAAGHLGRLPELTDAVLSLATEEIDGPIRTEKGWHIVRVKARRDERQRTFDEVRDDIAMKMRSRNEGQVYSDVVDSLKHAFDVTFFDDALELFYLLQMDEDQLFAAAQKEQDPQRKIPMYEGILERFPESEHCPEALFMIGFERAERMADTTGAVDAFLRFLSEYSDHELASSATLMLNELQPSAAGTQSGSGRED
jgi:hypothetical protein